MVNDRDHMNRCLTVTESLTSAILSLQVYTKTTAKFMVLLTVEVLLMKKQKIKS